MENDPKTKVLNEDEAFELWWADAFFNQDMMSLKEICRIVWSQGWSAAEDSAPRCPECGSYKLRCIDGHTWEIPN